MWIQGLMGIVGFIFIFIILSKLSHMVINKWFPKTANELAKASLEKEIEKLQTLKVTFETKRIQASLKKDELKIEEKILEVDKKLEELKTNLRNLNNGE